eukprot:TRINITY_DN10759_c0_g1_i2.p1 TRINITY_DN10759_c0_g1~~TRINITY_DN10759_c0_g1_i2.p1  ORF type:complete len:586 (+),score=58.35 TRINITY_DN10759_c0_g1_i2:71-1828(+)
MPTLRASHFHGEVASGSPLSARGQHHAEIVPGSPLSARGRRRFGPRYLPECTAKTLLPPMLTCDLATRLTDGNSQISDRVSMISERLGDTRSIDPIWVIPKLQSSDPHVRVLAATTLGGMGPAAGSHAAAVADRLADEDDRVWRSAGKALCQMGVAGLTTLATRLKDPQALVRGRVAQCFGWIGHKADPFVNALAETMDHGDDAAWGHAADTLVSLGEVSTAALRWRLWHGNERVQQRLRRMGETGASVFANAPKLPVSADSDIFLQASAALGKMGSVGADMLVAWLKHSDPHMRMQALNQLGHMGRDGDKRLGFMVRLLMDPDLRVRRRALEVLNSMGQPAVDEVARSLEKDGCAFDLSIYAETLGEMGNGACPHAHVLVNKLAESNVHVWRNAGESLVRLGPAGAAALGVKLESLVHKDAYWRFRIEEVLSWMGPLGAATLENKLGSSRAQVRMHAARALGRMGSDAFQHVGALGKTLSVDRDASVRRAAAEALTRLGEAGLAVLKSCESDRDPDVRFLAKSTLDLVAAKELSRSADLTIRREGLTPAWAIACNSTELGGEAAWDLICDSRLHGTDCVGLEKV